MRPVQNPWALSCQHCNSWLRRPSRFGERWSGNGRASRAWRMLSARSGSGVESPTLSHGLRNLNATSGRSQVLMPLSGNGMLLLAAPRCLPLRLRGPWPMRPPGPPTTFRRRRSAPSLPARWPRATCRTGSAWSRPAWQRSRAARPPFAWRLRATA